MNETLNVSVVDQVGDAAERLFADIAETGGRAAHEALQAGHWPEASWQKVEDAGLASLLADDMDGEGWACAAAVFGAFGYHAVGLPLIETAVARGLLVRVAGGVDLAGPWAIAQLSDQRGARLLRHGDTVRIDGRLDAVPWARYAAHVLVSGHLEGLPTLAVLALHGHPGVTVEAGSNLAGEPRDALLCEQARVVAVHSVPAALGHEPVRQWAALAAAAAMAGASRRVLDLSLLYANDRVQFGRSIGKFQVLQHALASLGCEVAAATMAVQVGCDAAEWHAAVGQVAVAKVRAGQAAGHAAAVGHQVHGAIGFTEEHMLQHTTRRLWSWRREWGTERDWATLLGARIVQGGGERVWAELVALSSGAAARARGA